MNETPTHFNELSQQDQDRVLAALDANQSLILECNAAAQSGDTMALEALIAYWTQQGIDAIAFNWDDPSSLKILAEENWKSRKTTK